jgi:hypothetical protein
MGASLVQHRASFGTGVTSLALAFSSANALHNLLSYLVGTGNGLSITACTDSNTNTIVNDANISGTPDARADHVDDSHSGANTVTAHSLTADIHLHILEIAGCVTTSALRDSNAISNSSTGSVTTAGTSTLAGDAVVGFFEDDAANDALTVGSGYGGSDLSANSGGNDTALSEFMAASAGGAQTATCGGNGASVLAQIIVTYKASSVAAVPSIASWQPPPATPAVPFSNQVPF